MTERIGRPMIPPVEPVKPAKKIGEKAPGSGDIIQPPDEPVEIGEDGKPKRKKPVEPVVGESLDIEA